MGRVRRPSLSSLTRFTSEVQTTNQIVLQLLKGDSSLTKDKILCPDAIQGNIHMGGSNKNQQKIVSEPSKWQNHIQKSCNIFLNFHAKYFLKLKFSIFFTKTVKYNPSFQINFGNFYKIFFLKAFTPLIISQNSIQSRLTSCFLN